MEQIEIALSRKKKVLLFFGLIAIIIFSILIIIEPAKYARIGKSSEFLRIVGIAGFVFSIIGLQRFIKKAKDKIGLIINEKGILDNSSSLKSIFIDWESITGIRTSNVMSTKFLLLDTNDPQKYIKENSNLKGNFNLHGTPLLISSVALNCSFDELEKMIKVEFEKHKVKVPNS